MATRIKKQARCFWCKRYAREKQDDKYTDISCKLCGVGRISGGNDGEAS